MCRPGRTPPYAETNTPTNFVFMTSPNLKFNLVMSKYGIKQTWRFRKGLPREPEGATTPTTGQQ